MSDFLKNSGVSRRGFLVKASAVASLCLLDCEDPAQQPEPPKLVKALDDPAVIHGLVTFRSGEGEIDGYLSRPNRKGRFPIVIVVTGSTISEEYIPHMTAMLAQKGFIGIAPNIFTLQKDAMTPDEKRKVFAEQITDELIYQDLQAAIDHLKKQEFANTKKIGITGFCFGGRCALMFAAHSKEIDAVVPFYGNLRTPASANRKQDPLDVLDKIRVPVKGHYAENDPTAPLDQINLFEAGLRKNHAKVEIFTYPASHGFFAYTRKTYDAEAARLSWERTATFFRKTLG